MRLVTEWWGIQILAETDEDSLILEELKRALPKKAENAYEEGEVSVVTEEDPCYGFNQFAINSSKLVLQILR